MALSENKWFVRFWYAHGDRLIFMALATLFGAGFYYIGMQAEAKTIWSLVVGMCINKARGVVKKDDND